MLQIIETNLRFKQTPAKRDRTDYIVLHHADASRCTVQDIHRWHLQKGYLGIGYNFFVDKQGDIYRGRPLNTIGAQCLNYNYRSIGVCAEGNYEQERMPGLQINAIASLLAELKRNYFENAKIVGHRDLYATICPGRNYPFAEIVDAVKTKMLFKGVSDMFEDINGHWAENDISEAVNIGLVVKSEKFRPDDNITRAETIALIMRLYRLLKGDA